MGFLSKFLQIQVIFVLFFGLISCTSQPNQKKDHFLISPPKLNSKDLTPQNDLAQQIVANATDHLAFDPAQMQGVQMSVETECHWQDGIVQELQALEPGHLWSLLRLMPPKLLLRPHLSATPLTCRFSFVATNIHGSKHRFHLGPITVQNLNSGDSVAIERNFDRLTSTDQALQFTKDTWNEIHFTSLKGFERAELRCDRWSAPLPVHSTHRLHLQDLPMHLIFKHQGIHPAPYCRIVSFDSARQIGISPLFQLYLYEPQIALKHTLVYQNPYHVHHPQRDWMAVHLSNQDARPWWIFVPKARTAPHAIQMLQFVEKTRVVFHTQMAFQFVPRGGNASLIEESSKGYLFEIKAGDHLVLGVLIPQMPSCSMRSHPGISAPPTTPVGIRLSPWVRGAPQIFSRDPRQGSALKPEWPAATLPVSARTGLIPFHTFTESTLRPSPLDIEHDGSKGYCR